MNVVMTSLDPVRVAVTWSMLVLDVTKVFAHNYHNHVYKNISLQLLTLYNTESLAKSRGCLRIAILEV